MGRMCKVCDVEIPAKRLAAQPNATMCVPCLEKSGDVRRLKRYDDHDIHGEEVGQTYFVEDERLEARLKRISAMHIPSEDEMTEDDSNTSVASSHHLSGEFVHLQDNLEEAIKAVKNTVVESPDKDRQPGKVLVIKSSQEARYGSSNQQPVSAAA